jgi:MFS family permease
MATETEIQSELTILNDDHVKSLQTSSARAREELVCATPEHPLQLDAQNNAPPSHFLSGGRSIITTIQLAGVNFITTYNTGLITVALPAMSKTLDLRPSLLVWPMSAYTLTMSTCLLPAGAVADVIGARRANLTGCFFIALLVLASGFSQTGIQLIVFRAMQGIAGAFAVPTSLSVVSKSIESGKRRNLAFSILGLAQILGFSLGLVLGGLFVSGPGWRVGEYVGGAIGFLLFGVGLWIIPKDAKESRETPMWKRLATEVDWIGAGCASVSIALLSYVLA